ncbi:hypothetical protein X798_01046 [Onchocerca flexuosa]|uniref:Uncharacterized protein n=1 Tax=Onchocerca flexuosa TaxID=387005 RepID=A0A238C3Z3_9BILA|nr:hypothetical protein X798_01046 [Onchocerca flexuosa]
MNSVLGESRQQLSLIAERRKSSMFCWGELIELTDVKISSQKKLNITSEVLNFKTKIANDADQCLSPDFGMLNEKVIQEYSTEKTLNINISSSDNCIGEIGCVEGAGLNKLENNEHKSEISTGQSKKALKDELTASIILIATTPSPSQKEASLTVEGMILFPKSSTLSPNHTRSIETAAFSPNRNDVIDASSNSTTRKQ